MWHQDVPQQRKQDAIQEDGQEQVRTECGLKG